MSAPAASWGKVAVLYGGTSAERPISLKSGAAVLAALQQRGIDAHGIDVQADIMARLMQANPRYDRAFIALHGRGGEDGVIQGVLEQLGIPYTGSGVMASAISMDKLRSKWVWLGMGLPTPPFYCADELDSAAVVAQLGLPVIVKPSREGSSLGVAKATTVAELEQAWLQARQYDRQVLVERWIDGKEYTVAILGERALPVIGLETPHVLYDYEAKYQANSTRYLCPCLLPAEQEQQLQALALQAFQGVGAKGWGRLDIFMDQQQRPWLIEINTVPGMTDHSLVPMAAKAAGLDFNELVYQILQTAV